MNKLETALELASKGFYVHPLRPNKKVPVLAGWPQEATRDHAKIRMWWEMNPDLNIGIAPEKFGDDESLLVVDIDNRDGKKGDETILNLEFVGKDFPPTYTQITPSGGRHLIYRCKTPVKKSTDSVFGKNTGVDILSRGSNLAAKGSTINGKPYEAQDLPIVDAPEWLVELCGKATEREETQIELIEGVNADRAKSRAIDYLTNHAPLAVKNQGGDLTTYRVAAKVKDFGVDAATCLEILLDFWNDRTTPGWTPERLKEKVDHAYRYGTEPVGVSDPAADFEPLTKAAEADPELKALLTADTSVHPFEKLNKEFAWVLSGSRSHIIWETTDKDGGFELRHLEEEAFHKKFASKKFMDASGKMKALTKLWMEDESRRSYDGLCFSPGKEVPSRFYNLWRGYAFTPMENGELPSVQAKDAVDAFLEHVLHNVCLGDETHFRWLIGWCAHLMQRPFDKPLTALVLQGGMGTGKNAFLETIGNLVKHHFVLADNDRYLTGNFNSHLEHCLLLGLNEAFWSGNKNAEAILKGLITERTRLIERKFTDPYTVANLTRVVIMGNDDWVAPVALDDRRFAVFHVGDGRKQDRRFFQTMREGMEAGGYRLLLRYMMDFDLSTVEVNAAPKTKALLQQKIRSLSPLGQWWYHCLTEGRIVGSDYSEGWIDEIEKEKVREAFGRYLKARNINGRVPMAHVFGQQISENCKSISTGRRGGENAPRTYRFPPLDVARQEWESVVGHKIMWEAIL